MGFFVGSILKSIRADEVIIFRGYTWLLLNGQQFPVGMYPDLDNVFPGIPIYDTEKLSPVMISNNNPAPFVTTRSSQHHTFDAWQAFGDSTVWIPTFGLVPGPGATGAATPQWVQMTFGGQPLTLNYYALSAGHDHNQRPGVDSPSHWNVQILNGEGNWVTVDMRQDITWPETGPITRSYSFDNIEAFGFRWTVERQNGPRGTVLVALEFGHRESLGYLSELPNIPPDAQGLNTYALANIIPVPSTGMGD
jgi:hypothetical protein